MDRTPPTLADNTGLCLTGVTLRDGRNMALDAIDLDLPRGAFCSVLGKPGSGKSALIAVVAGTAVPAAGEARLQTTNLLPLPLHRRGLGVVQQHDALFPQLTLAENIAYPLRLRGVGRTDRKSLVEAALDLVQLTHASRYPHEITAAERQRAAWARATIFGPRVLLLDEPLSDQNPAGRPAMLAILRRLHIMLGGVTLMATQVASDAMALSDRIVVLDRGRIAQTGAPASVYDQPISAEAALAGGEANLLPGTVHAIDEDGLARVGLACGPTVEATASTNLRVRDACLFFIRPERIAVAAMRAGDMGDGALDATLLEALNLGDTVRLRLLLGSGAELLVKRPLGAGTQGLRTGQPVAVAWQPEHAAVFSGT
jgi:putative spermidine/putrescine transport system ATP-binding protein